MTIALSGREKATIFLSILGPETSSRILRYLPGDLADVVAASINHLPTPTPEALGEVFSDFKSLFALPSASSGKLDAAEVVFDKANMAPKEIIENSPAQSVVFVLSEERPQMAAFVLSFISEKKRSEIISLMTSQRDMILDLMKDMKKSPVTKALEDKLLQHFAAKL
ncbi:MAG: hypothetical protein FD145_1267 [Candidatus Saganbacteria bacterium]|uniref:Flagellar motor switch protein FliG N-terminal domain-containing protein n=1 Tax=Candidatus Saganbacteria bacterium TaxID=2575572 RepID=A0A833NY58_UNCSA|nr:MAG: hypothetical protein FD145_1267 [Candidatus Saganbacteria bacterium]